MVEIKVVKTVVRRSKKSAKELARKRTLAGLLNYGVFSFGPSKKDYFLRLTPFSIIENRYFTFRYIAVIDAFILIGLILWWQGYSVGVGMAAFFTLLAIVVFVNQEELEKRTRIVTKKLAKTLPKS